MDFVGNDVFFENHGQPDIIEEGAQPGSFISNDQASHTFRSSFKSEAHEFHNTNYNMEQTDCDLLNDTGADQLQVNIYESDDEEKNHSGSPDITKSLVESTTGDELPLQPAIELAKLGSFKESKLNAFEQHEKLLHYQRTSEQYEKLYAEYLEKFILERKEKELLSHQQRNSIWLINKIAWGQARYYALPLDQRKLVLLIAGFFLLVLLISIIF